MSTVDRRNCPGRRGHGTRVAYREHGCRCLDALADDRTYRKRRRAGHIPPATVSTTGTRRRLQALQAIGWPQAHLARELGYSGAASLSPMLLRPTVRRDLADRINALYERLSGTPGPSRSARLRAQRSGHASPLAWDGVDMDNPAAEPDATEEPDGAPEADPVAVLRLVRGEIDPTCTSRADQVAAAAELHRRGYSRPAIADRVGGTRYTVAGLLQASG